MAWEPRRRNFLGSVQAVFGGPEAPKEFPGGPYFGNNWVHSPVPKRAMLASVLWHIVLVNFPFPLWKESEARTQLTLPRIEVTWSGPLQDLPPISPAGPPSKPSPPGEPPKPLPRRGADAFHPRQTIISMPERTTHPRQTLIQPEAPPEPPKILLPLPNMVQWAAVPQPSRPRLQISQAALARLRPKKPAMRPPSELPVPEVPNLEKHVGAVNIASNAMSAPKPQLPMAPTSIPRPSPQQAGQDASSAPDIRPNANNGEAGVHRLIALSATPAAEIANLPIPSGNLRARLSISPEGTQPGVPGGSASGAPGATAGPANPGGTQPGTGGGGGSGPPGVSISGGNPNTSSVSGAGVSSSSVPGGANSSPARLANPASRPALAHPDRMPPAPGFDRIQPGAPPEAVFGPKQVYTLHVNMPNLASATGSWVLSFTELRPPEDDYGKATPAPGDLTGPVPLHKVDPKYPPSLMSAKVEGEVVLYAVIRKDGSVDSIQLVRGVDAQLDGNAMEAFSRWKFRPAQRQGAPVELEAIVHIPFRAVAPLY